MPIGPARMPIMDHLGELRMRLVRIVVALAVSVCIFYLATPTIAQFLVMPIAEFLPTDAQGMAVLTAGYLWWRARPLFCGRFWRFSFRR